jgi:hypothetical protein
VQGGMGISAETAVINVRVAPTSNKAFFNMIKSPRVFELNSQNSRIHGKIKRQRGPHVKMAEEFRKPEHFPATARRKP